MGAVLGDSVQDSIQDPRKGPHFSTPAQSCRLKAEDGLGDATVAEPDTLAQRAGGHRGVGPLPLSPPSGPQFLPPSLLCWGLL